MEYKSFHLTSIGASHMRRQKECQDDSAHYCDDKMAVAIVCDGHGGDDYVRSAIGAKLACAVAEKNIKSFIENMDIKDVIINPEQAFNQLEKSIINAWNEAVEMHHVSSPFTSEELSQISDKAKYKYVAEESIESAYGTTLIAVALTDKYWFGIHIGDGKCVTIDRESKFSQLIPWDDKCFLNATTSICDTSALDNFRYFFSEDLPVAIFIGTDGIDDSFRNDEQLYNLYETIIYSFGCTDFERAEKELKEYLPRLTARGSGDDISIAAIMNQGKLKDLDVYKKAKEKDNDRKRENEDYSYIQSNE